MSDVRSPKELGAAKTERAPSSPSWQHKEEREDIGGAETEVVSSAPSVQEPATHRGAAPAVGESIGRFTVLEVLGRGGMGIVVSAYDPHLDRRVAIKLVSTPGKAKEQRDRLIREARAMAQLRHPNVVTVYEVGEHEGQVYLAMEQVKGGTLRHALRELERRGEHGWREILNLFVQAGQGLAAAHAAGMVHRDFKPDNIFVDHGDRVLVGDFGLVSPLQSTPSASGDDAQLREPFTRADVVVGTPAYMAPEQHRGEAVDARADQFAFCVGLYEALYGELPFPGKTRLDYVKAMERGDVRAPPTGRKLPAWLRAVLGRGLSADPNARYSSVDALLTDLGADPNRAWRVGQRMRIAFVTAAVAFTIAWFTAVLGFDLELDYGLHYTTSIGFLCVIFGAAWVGRRTLSRTAFNRTLMSTGLALAASLVLLVAGSHLLGLSGTKMGVLYLFGMGTALLIMATAIDPRLGVPAAVYMAGFLVAAASPALLLLSLFVGHATAAIGIYLVVTSRSARAS